MDLGCEYVYKKSLTLYLALSPALAERNCTPFSPLGRAYEGQIFRISLALYICINLLINVLLLNILIYVNLQPIWVYFKQEI